MGAASSVAAADTYGSVNEALAAGVAQADVDAYLAEAAGAWQPPSTREGARTIQGEFKALETKLAGGGTWDQDDEARVRALIERTRVYMRACKDQGGANLRSLKLVRAQRQRSRGRAAVART